MSLSLFYISSGCLWVRTSQAINKIHTKTHIEIVISHTLIWNIPILFISTVSCNNGIGVAYLHFLAACRARTHLLHDNQWCPRQPNTESLSCVRPHASTPTDLTVNGKNSTRYFIRKTNHMRFTL
jgi:hypothetical protein